MADFCDEDFQTSYIDSKITIKYPLGLSGLSAFVLSPILSTSKSNEYILTPRFTGSVLSRNDLEIFYENKMEKSINDSIIKLAKKYSNQYHDIEMKFDDIFKRKILHDIFDTSSIQIFESFDKKKIQGISKYIIFLISNPFIGSIDHFICDPNGLKYILSWVICRVKNQYILCINPCRKFMNHLVYNGFTKFGEYQNYPIVAAGYNNDFYLQYLSKTSFHFNTLLRPHYSSLHVLSSSLFQTIRTKYFDCEFQDSIFDNFVTCATSMIHFARFFYPLITFSPELLISVFNADEILDYSQSIINRSSIQLIVQDYYSYLGFLYYLVKLLNSLKDDRSEMDVSITNYHQIQDYANTCLIFFPHVEVKYRDICSIIFKIYQDYRLPSDKMAYSHSLPDNIIITELINQFRDLKPKFSRIFQKDTEYQYKCDSSFMNLIEKLKNIFISNIQEKFV